MGEGEGGGRVGGRAGEGGRQGFPPVHSLVLQHVTVHGVSLQGFPPEHGRMWE